MIVEPPPPRLPLYNHTRGDSHLEPCEECKEVLVLIDRNKKLTQYLQEALARIPDRRKTVERIIELDPAGNTYEVDWSPWYVEVTTFLFGKPPDLF